MSKWEAGQTTVPYRDGRQIWMRPADREPLELGSHGRVRLTAAEARDLAAQLLAAAEKLDSQQPDACIHQVALTSRCAECERRR